MPGSAVLVFDIELLELVAGLPEGYMFVWNDEVSPNLYEEIDKDGNGEVLLVEVTDLKGKWDQSGWGTFVGRGPALNVKPSQREGSPVLLVVADTLMYQALLHTV